MLCALSRACVAVATLNAIPELRTLCVCVRVCVCVCVCDLQDIIVLIANTVLPMYETEICCLQYKPSFRTNCVGVYIHICISLACVYIYVVGVN